MCELWLCRRAKSRHERRILQLQWPSHLLLQNACQWICSTTFSTLRVFVASDCIQSRLHFLRPPPAHCCTHPTLKEVYLVATLDRPVVTKGFAVRVRSAGQKYGPTCHQRDRADVTKFVTLVRLSSLGQHVGVVALAGYKRRKSALTAGTICFRQKSIQRFIDFCFQL